MQRGMLAITAVAAVVFLHAAPAAAQKKESTASASSAASNLDPQADRDDTKDPPGTRRLMPDGKVWLDLKNKRVIVVGEVCQREGQMEMFACLKGTKEHESIVAVPTKAHVVHAALIRLGAMPGAAAQFVPKYQPAHGPRVDVTVYWTDEQGKRRQANAQDWIRNVKTGRAMTDYWVFGGSGFWKDDTSGEEFYKAEDGDFICISNFNSAMLDLPVESSQSNEALLFEALTDAIPPLGTKVSVVLTPRLDEKAKSKPPAK
ncbi:MAG TPA: YdjY domain-containing protein [Pirellulales bacterium]|nr:YdjY domain-containing protein [Pirellulales bacterium]